MRGPLGAALGACAIVFVFVFWRESVGDSFVANHSGAAPEYRGVLALLPGRLANLISAALMAVMLGAMFTPFGLAAGWLITLVVGRFSHG